MLVLLKNVQKWVMENVKGWHIMIIANIMYIVVYSLCLAALQFSVSALRKDIIKIETKYLLEDDAETTLYKSQEQALDDLSTRMWNLENSVGGVRNELENLPDYEPVDVRPLSNRIDDIELKLKGFEKIFPVHPSPDMTYIPVGFAEMTWYGDYGDKTGASKHGYQCYDTVTLELVQDRVNDWQFGVAAPRWLPYCTDLLICRTDSGQCVRAVKVDVLGKDSTSYNENTGSLEYLDAWPAVAEALGFGPSYGEQDSGRIHVEWFVGR